MDIAELKDITPKEKKVFVKLKAPMWHDNRVCEKGEVVELPKIFAASAGEIVTVKKNEEIK